MTKPESQKRQIKAYNDYIQNPSKPVTKSVERLINRGADLTGNLRPFLPKTPTTVTKLKAKITPTKVAKPVVTKPTVSKPSKSRKKSVTQLKPSTVKNYKDAYRNYQQNPKKRYSKRQKYNINRGAELNRKKPIFDSKGKKILQTVVARPPKPPKQPPTIPTQPPTTPTTPKIDSRVESTKHEERIFMKTSKPTNSFMNIDKPNIKPGDKYVQCVVFLYYENEATPQIFSSFLAKAHDYQLCIDDIHSKSCKPGQIVGYSVKWYYLG